MDDPWIGKTIGGCLLQSLIGRGGMGAIYLAHQIHLDRKVAVKLLLSSKLISQNPEKESLVKRFQQEARLAAKLQHPNAMQVYNFGEEEGVYYIVMQYIDGVNLDYLIKKNGPFTIQECVYILKEVARPLVVAHEQGIIHRDIKPANIMKRQDNSIVLTDFGLAKPLHLLSTLSSPGDCIGTLGYMSPEQASGQGEVDHRTDIYSLGASVFHLLTGRRPFEGNNPVEIVYKQVTSTPPGIQELRKDIPLPLVKVIEKMMDRDLKKRFQSVHHLLTVVESLENKGAFPTHSPKSSRMRPKVKATTQLLPSPVLSGEQELTGRLRKYFHLSKSNPCQAQGCSQVWKLEQIANQESLLFNGKVWCKECLWHQFSLTLAGAKIGKYDVGSFGDYWLAIKGADYFMPNEPAQFIYRFPLKKPKKGWDRMLQRIERGFSLVSQISSHTLLRVGRYVAMQEHGFAYVPIEYIAGATLDQLIEGEAFTLRETVTLLRKLAQSLGILHENGLVHRNVTPHSIYLSLNGGARLGNFTMTKSLVSQQQAFTASVAGGVAPFKEYCMEYWLQVDDDTGETPTFIPGNITTNFNCILGTLAYMSPEQTLGVQGVDSRSDLWSWGVVGFGLLEGKRPFPEDNLWDTAQAIREKELPLLSQEIPTSLQKIIYKALEKNVEKRFQSANEIIQSLDLLKL
jgi:serine/threonine protein kinase